jgi:hypothetical protein
MRWVTRGIGVAAGIVLIALGGSTRAFGVLLLVVSVTSAVWFARLQGL